MAGLFAISHRDTTSLIAPGCGAGGKGNGILIDPQPILSCITGRNKISIGKSISTGPVSLVLGEEQLREGFRQLTWGA